MRYTMASRGNEPTGIHDARRAALKFSGGLYYAQEGGHEVGPVCPYCFGTDGFVCLLRKVGRIHRCLTCGRRSYDGRS